MVDADRIVPADLDEQIPGRALRIELVDRELLERPQPRRDLRGPRRPHEPGTEAERHRQPRGIVGELRFGVRQWRHTLCERGRVIGEQTQPALDVIGRRPRFEGEREELPVRLRHRLDAGLMLAVERLRDRAVGTLGVSPRLLVDLLVRGPSHAESGERTDGSRPAGDGRRHDEASTAEAGAGRALSVRGRIGFRS